MAFRSPADGRGCRHQERYWQDLPLTVRSDPSPQAYASRVIDGERDSLPGAEID